MNTGTARRRSRAATRWAGERLQRRAVYNTIDAARRRAWHRATTSSSAATPRRCSAVTSTPVPTRTSSRTARPTRWPWSWAGDHRHGELRGRCSWLHRRLGLRPRGFRSGGQRAQGISRFPDGADTDMNNVDLSPRCITPGAPNTIDSSGCTEPTLPQLVINEIDYDQPRHRHLRSSSRSRTSARRRPISTRFSLVLVNGGGGAAVYNTIDLPAPPSRRATTSWSAATRPTWSIATSTRLPTAT